MQWNSWANWDPLASHSGIIFFLCIESQEVLEKDRVFQTKSRPISDSESHGKSWIFFRMSCMNPEVLYRKNNKMKYLLRCKMEMKK